MAQAAARDSAREKNEGKGLNESQKERKVRGRRQGGGGEGRGGGVKGREEG